MKARQGTRSVLGSTITTAGQRNWVVQLCGASTISFEFFWLAAALQLGQLQLSSWVAPGITALAEFFLRF